MNLKRAILLGVIVMVILLFSYTRYLSPTARLLAAMENSDAPAIAKAIQSGAKLHEAPHWLLALAHLTPQSYRPYAIMSGVARNSDTQMMQLLIDGGANPSRRDDAGLVPLHYAASRGEVRMVAVLLNADADVDAAAPQPRVTESSLLLGEIPEEGMTPLMLAARYHDYDTVALLLKHGARADLKDAKGRTALKHALEFQKRLTRSKSAAFVETYRSLSN